ncbi:MAG: histone deacetylase [Candidatus Thermoplasmatota archaeon]|nr:histone deacetylase [Candidatus Thermoplasmatota archaeon]
MTAIIYSSDFLLHNSPGHPETTERLVAIMDFLKEMPFFDELSIVEPAMIGEEELIEVHSREMVERVKDTTGWLDPDTYVVKDSYRVTRLAAGGVVKACDEVMNGREENAFALIRPPGHHATKNRSMGFCLFNNAALAANFVTKHKKKVLIFDHDVHHGNGTCDIFYDRNDVLYQSIHLSPHYPGTGMTDEIGKGVGEAFTINAPLPRGVGTKGIGKVLDEVMIPVAEQFSPDFIIISAGFDSHHSDALGGLALTIDFYGEIIKKFSLIQNRIVCTLEGGYKLDVLRKGVASEIGMLNHTPVHFEDSFENERDADEVVNRLKNVLGSYWTL